jgi:hypothetical protein
LNSNYVRWLSVYLRGRSACCSFNGATSNHCKVKSGFPQGSVLSPDLWNAFVSDCPTPAEIQEAYADDLSQLDSDTDIGCLGIKLSNSVNEVVEWSKRKNLVIAPAKSQIILFTPDVHQSNVHPQVCIDGQLIPLSKKLKILGCWWDTHFCYGAQASETFISLGKRVPIVKAVSNQAWGFDKETLTLTFNTLVKPVIGNCAPVWVPNIKPTHIAKLQTMQNRFLRLITGCHQASSVDHLHREVGILPVGIRLDMLCKQFLVSALRRAHPSHEVVLRPPGPRKNSKGRPMKETLSSKYLSSVDHFLSDGIMSEVSYKRTLKTIHSDTVSHVKSIQGINPLLGCRPPPVSASEQRLI